MIETTIAKAGPNLVEIVSQCQRRDEQFHLFERCGDISPAINGIPQPHAAEPVAVVISARRYKWLVSRSTELDKLTRRQ